MVGRDAFIATYMLASEYRGTIYFGVTSELVSRISTHREGRLPGFTRQHGVKRLVWYENHDRMTDAIQREKSLKRWPRQWKINLIERDNPGWDDLYPTLVKPVWLPPPQWKQSQTHPQPVILGLVPRIPLSAVRAEGR